MGQEISLFPRYAVKENRVTNYTMLMVKLVYEESPLLYQDLLDAVLPTLTLRALPKFEQQKPSKASVPDGVITQRAYTIHIETKTSDWFYGDQLSSHIRGLAERADGGTRVLIALAPFADGGQEELERQYNREESDAPSAVLLRALSFRDFAEALPPASPETQLARTIEEYRSYLNDEGLLGSWQDWLDVVNCAVWPEHFTDALVYTCPVEGAAYSHRRCKFLGLYKNKTVSHVAEIRGVVIVSPDGNGSVQWSNDGTSADELLALGRERALKAWGGLVDEERRVFVLSEPCPTAFVKDTKGGMLGSKKYFDISSLAVSGAAHLAEALQGRSWSGLHEQW